MTKNPRLIDMTGNRHGKWTVLHKAGNTKGGGAVWACRCDCGTERNVLGSDLRRGASASCGCDGVKRIGALNRTHGDTKTRLYCIWQNMRARCYREGATSYEWYGARGIRVCDDWQNYEPFREWALKSGYRSELTIERLDSAADYSPSNCTWATPQRQSENREYTQKAPDGQLWLHKARENGIRDATFRDRVHRLGWPIEEAATRPVRRRK